METQPGMHQHPYFNLRLHDDAELERLVGAALARRQTLHEWPLSCVHKLTLADGRCLVYKAAYGPTVEAEFYARAHSPLLLPARTVYQQDGYACLLLEWVGAPRLEDLALPEGEMLALIEEILDAIASIQGDLPYYLDLRSASAWQDAMDEMLANLQRLLEEGKLHQLTAQALQAFQGWAQAPEVLEALAENPGLAHTDLGGDNILVTPQGLRVIDWQRPIHGPRALDRLRLLESAGIGLDGRVSTGILRVQRLLSIHWLAEAASRWFPEGVETYDRQIALLAEQLAEGS